LTVKEAGDGTTTATVLASSFIKNLKDFEYKDIELAFNTIIPQVIKNLKLAQRKLKRMIFYM
jgi:chaperonin GroEL (HSP60 family)